MQRLTNLCSVLNDMEPICVLNHVFVLREVKQCVYSSFSCCLCDDGIVKNMWIPPSSIKGETSPPSAVVIKGVFVSCLESVEVFSV